jgi:hypothetical protein
MMPLHTKYVKNSTLWYLVCMAAISITSAMVSICNTDCASLEYISLDVALAFDKSHIRSKGSSGGRESWHGLCSGFQDQIASFFFDFHIHHFPIA